jgi:hypothetical protein
MTLLPDLLRSKEVLIPSWRLREMGDDSSSSCFDLRSNPNPIMNVLIWNCKDAMKPKFKTTLLDLVSWHHHAIVVVIETRMGGAKADAIIRTLPFDGAYSTETIGFAGGIWLFWLSDMVDVEVLSATEQEIHALIQVNSSPSPWLLSAIYASPRFVDRCVLWNNLITVAIVIISPGLSWGNLMN